MKRKVEIVVDEHDFAMLELLHDEVEPWDFDLSLKEEGEAVLRVLNQIVAKKDERN